jgi:hypothetical protein
MDRLPSRAPAASFRDLNEAWRSARVAIGAIRQRKEPHMALSDSQLVVLTTACQRPDRAIYPLTAKLPGGAASKVLGSLLTKGLIKEVQARREDTVWREDKKRGRLTLRAAPAAFKALGIDEAPTEDEAEPAPSAGAEAKPGRSRKADKSKTRGTRADSKQAKLIEMLKRPEGASIEEIVKAFKWQAHTVRGAIAGALKKKLGLNVTSEKVEERGRVYQIAD